MMEMGEEDEIDELEDEEAAVVTPKRRTRAAKKQKVAAASPIKKTATPASWSSTAGFRRVVGPISPMVGAPGSSGSMASGEGQTVMARDDGLRRKVERIGALVAKAIATNDLSEFAGLAIAQAVEELGGML